MPLTSHTQIETQIETFVENFRKSNSSYNPLSSALPPIALSPTGLTSPSSSDDSGPNTNHINNSINNNNNNNASSNSPTSSLSPTEDSFCSSSATEDPLEQRIQTDDIIDDTVCTLSVQDVAELLQAQYAIITGGKAQDGCPIITFPDTGTFCNISDEDYRKLIIYLTSVPSLQEADLGFILVIDRRNDKWNSVKTVLLKISGFFPGLIQVVFVLRPNGLFQKAISEVSNKLFKEEFKFKVIVCNCIEELHEYLDRNQLTKEFDGCIDYNHEEWIEQRVAVEKFFASTQQISLAIRNFIQHLQETELPNEASSTGELLVEQEKTFKDLKERLDTGNRHGELLLSSLRSNPSSSATVEGYSESKLINVVTVERLLVQLEETEKGFRDLWSRHHLKLQQCLELRNFEQEFRELQTNLDLDLRLIMEMVEIGDTVSRVKTLIEDMSQFQRNCQDDLDKANRLQRLGNQLIDNEHYAIDSIQPKCVELNRMCKDLNDRIIKRIELLHKNLDLQARIEKANKWCKKGVDLLASQQNEKCSSWELAEVALVEIEQFLQSSDEFQLNNPKEFHTIFEDTITLETKALVQQVLQRIDDVQVICEKRKASLRKMAAKPSRPVQPVVPEPAVPLTAPRSPQMTGAAPPQPANGDTQSATTQHQQPITTIPMKKMVRRARTVPKLPVRVIGETVTRWEPDSSPENDVTSCVENNNSELLRAKRGHVMTELLETERAYVSELLSIVKGYIEEMRNPEMQNLIPENLNGQSDILFGNLEAIYKFHNNVFLNDLENCIHTPESLGLCFVQRRESFHKLYSTYCLNKPQSEALRLQVGDNHSFFKECQRKLNHKLPLGAYLLKPVQRITKYQLLLKDLEKYSAGNDGGGEGCKHICEALACMLGVLKYVNDSMHQVAITGFPGNLADLGKLLMQGSFRVWTEHKNDRLRDLRLKPMQRHIFLYEKALLFCKRMGGKDVDHTTYQFKHCLKMSNIGLTESVHSSKGEQRKFELWLQGRAEVYTIQAPSMEVKDTWVQEIKRVLLQQFEHLKGENIKQYSAKIQKISSVNGIRPVVMTVPHKPLRQTTSWDYGMKAENDAANNGIEFGRRVSLRAASEPGSDLYDEDACSSDYSSDEEVVDLFGEHTELHGRYVALADYMVLDGGEVNLHEGDIVELKKVGNAGWWFVHVIGTANEGWTPASYLERITKRNSKSSPSVSSQESTNGGLKHATSKSSVTSSVSITSQGDANM